MNRGTKGRAASEAAAPSLDNVPLEQVKRFTPEQAKSYRTWSNYLNVLKSGNPSLRQKYMGIQHIASEESDCKRCEKHRDALFKNSPIIRYLQGEVAAVGPPLLPEHVRCLRCPIDDRRSGGFSKDYGILLCANEMHGKGHVEDTLAHELVHAYDYMRFNVDDNNMRHQACTEIRASALSGECRWTREFFLRNQWRLTSQMQECVRRRATASLAGRLQFDGDKEKAGKVINEVWDSCFNDLRPFDEHFR